MADFLSEIRLNISEHVTRYFRQRDAGEQNEEHAAAPDL